MEGFRQALAKRVLLFDGSMNGLLRLMGVETSARTF
jgi:hypothetical protein